MAASSISRRTLRAQAHRFTWNFMPLSACWTSRHCFNAQLVALSRSCESTVSVVAAALGATTWCNLSRRASDASRVRNPSSPRAAPHAAFAADGQHQQAQGHLTVCTSSVGAARAASRGLSRRLGRRSRVCRGCPTASVHPQRGARRGPYRQRTSHQVRESAPAPYSLRVCQQLPVDVA